MDSNSIVPIVIYIIKSVPIGHMKETLDNLRNLVGNEVLELKEVQDEIVLYEEEHFKHISLNEDKILLSTLTKDYENKYHDQGKQLSIQVSPLNDNIDNLNMYPEPVEDEFRSLLEQQVTAYKENNYKPGIVGSNGKI